MLNNAESDVCYIRQDNAVTELEGSASALSITDTTPNTTKNQRLELQVTLFLPVIQNSFNMKTTNLF